MAIEIAQNLDAINMVRAQQNIVGRSIIGGAGAIGGGNLIGQGEQTDILTSIQLISEKTFKAIKQQTDTIVKILEFDKKKDRREKEQRAEDKKEAKTGKGFIGPQKPTSFKDQDIQNNEKKGFGILEFFAASSLGKSLTKIFIPIRKFIGVIAKSRIGLMFARLGPLFAASGPLAIIGGALFVLFRYSKEIAAALSPAVESLKKAFENLKPVFDVVMYVVDVVFKNAINALGAVFTTVAGVVEGITGFIGGILNFLGGLIDLFKADEETQKEEAKTRLKNALSDIMNALFAPFKALITSVAGFIDGLIDSFKIPDWIKNKVKKVFKTGEDTNMDTSKFDTNNVRQKGFGGESTPDSKKSLFTSGGAYTSGETQPEIIPKEKPKTINVDKTTGATQVAEKIMKAEPVEFTTEQREKDIKSLDDFLSGSYSKRKNNLLSDLDAAGVKGPISRTGIDSVSGVDFDKKNAELLEKAKAAGMGFEFEQALMMSLRLREANLARTDLKMGMPDRPEIMKQFDEATNIKPRVRKKDVTGDTGSGSGGTVITDAKQTIVTNSNTTRQDTYVGGINTSSGDNYFDRQTGSYGT
jgi:hypothetical protein